MLRLGQPPRVKIRGTKEYAGMVELVDSVDLGDVTLGKVLSNNAETFVQRVDMKKSLFEESIENHQQLVDTLLRYQGDDGICRVSQKQLMCDMDRSLTWLKKALDRINTEEQCIELVDSSAYRVHCKSLLENGVFHRILLMIVDTFDNPEIVHMTDVDLINRYKCKLKTVQMYRAYVLSGWKKNMENFKALQDKAQSE